MIKYVFTVFYVAISMAFLLGCSDKGDNKVTSGEDAKVDEGETEVELTLDNGDEDSSWPALEPVVFAIVSDIHIDGDITSSTPSRVAALFARAVAMEPRPEFIAITGDLTEALPEPVDMSEGGRLKTLSAILAGSGSDIEGCLGNHDYYGADDLLYEFCSDRDARDDLFRDEIGFEPWYYTVHGGTKFIYLNSMHGDRWQESIGLNGSMGEAQLDWLDATLADGRPALLFVHHPPSTILERGSTTLTDIIEQHSANILAIFVGHVHVYARSTVAGVPLYVTDAGYKGEAVHHVRVDPASGSVEILNEGEIDYGETEFHQCDSTQGELPPASVLEGRTLTLSIPDSHVEPIGLGSYLREVVAQIPLVVHVKGVSGGDITGELTSGEYPGVCGEVGGDSEACPSVLLQVDGSCFSSEPVTLRVDLSRLLGLPLPAGWRIRADFENLVLSGRVDEEGLFVDGVLRADLSLAVGVKDIEAIIVQQYCGGKLAGCKPGTKGAPECSEEPDEGFFGKIPSVCDVEIAGLGLRTIFRVLDSVPGFVVEMDANFFVAE